MAAANLAGQQQVWIGKQEQDKQEKEEEKQVEEEKEKEEEQEEKEEEKAAGARHLFAVYPVCCCTAFCLSASSSTPFIAVLGHS